MAEAMLNAGVGERVVRRPRPHWKKLDLGLHAAQIGLGLVLLGIWHLAATREWVSPVLAKTPEQTWDYLVPVYQSGELMANTRATMVAVVIAWVIASIAGVLCGIALALLPRIERVITPYLDAANAMPRIALAPLFIVAFGINTTAKVALACTLVFFIVLSGARAGVRSAESDWLRLATVLDASKAQMFRMVLLPFATPAIFAALRLGLIYSLLGVVGSELISARDGLGQMIAVNSATFHMEGVYGILLFLSVIAVILNQGMSLLERWLLRWQAPADR